jgi:deazaflavin-dependent oxidoreductase (nitroreductase family)
MGALTPLAVRIGAVSWMPRLLPQITWLDRHLQQLTRGRLTLLDLAGLPNLMLTVRGRRTGVERSTPLLCVPLGAAFLIAGSNFGGPTQPAWVVNLEATMAGRLRHQGLEQPFTARAVTGEERAELWPTMLAVWPNFARYEQRTTRTIKVFELTPVEGAST